MHNLLFVFLGAFFNEERIFLSLSNCIRYLLFAWNNFAYSEGIVNWVFCLAELHLKGGSVGGWNREERWEVHRNGVEMLILSCWSRNCIWTVCLGLRLRDQPKNQEKCHLWNWIWSVRTEALLKEEVWHMVALENFQPNK